MKRIFVHWPDKSASTLYRAILPCRYCSADLSLEGIELVGMGPDCNSQGWYDAFVLLRSAIADECGRRGPVVVNLDDDFWNIPDWNPASQIFGPSALEDLGKACAAAAEVWVSTEALAVRAACLFASGGHHVAILPNLIAPSLWPKREPNKSGPVRILWAGTNTHHGDLQEITAAVEKLALEYREHVYFTFFGYAPDGLFALVQDPARCFPIQRDWRGDLVSAMVTPRFSNVEYLPWVDITEYRHALVSLRPDIALCPLAPCKFNESKSNLKWLEMTMAGAECICSNFGPFADTKIPAMKPVTAADWYTAIRTAIEDSEGRARTLAASRELIMDLYSWESGSGRTKWLEAFRGLVA